MELKEIKRGDLYYADLRPIIGSEQGGVRPVLIIQNDVGNHFSPTVIAASITSRQRKHRLPTQFFCQSVQRACDVTPLSCWNRYAPLTEAGLAIT